MTLMPVSKTSDLVERRANGGGAWWTERHSTSLECRAVVYGGTKNVKHARKNWLTNRCFQRPTRVPHRHSARKTLCRCQCDAAHTMCVALCQYFNHNVIFGPGA